MLYLIAGIVVLALVVLGAIAFGVLGAMGRLRREVAATERDVRPLLAQAQAVSEAAAARERATSSD